MAGVFIPSPPSAPSASASTWLNLPIFFKLSSADLRVSFRLFSRIQPSLSHSGSSGFAMLSRDVCRRRKPAITDICAMQWKRQRVSGKPLYPCPCLHHSLLSAAQAAKSAKKIQVKGCGNPPNERRSWAAFPLGWPAGLGGSWQEENVPSQVGKERVEVWNRGVPQEVWQLISNEWMHQLRKEVRAGCCKAAALCGHVHKGAFHVPRHRVGASWEILMRPLLLCSRCT